MSDRLTTFGLSLLSFYPSQSGGTGTYVRGILSRLRPELARERVVVISHGEGIDAYGALRRPGVEMVRVRSTSSSRRSARLAALAYRLAAPVAVQRDVPRRLDVVHYVQAVPAPRSSSPRIVTLHDVLHLDHPEFFSAAQRQWRRHAYDGAARSSALVVTVSEHARERIIDRLEIPPNRVVAIHHGIDHDCWSPDSGRADHLIEQKLGSRPFLVYPAALHPHKNHARLFSALSRVPDVDLVLTGPVYDKLESVLTHAGEAGVAERVRHLGFVEKDLLPALYRKARAMIFPSLYEGFGAPPLEAMACGLPVAVSDAASLPEICGDAALRFPPLDVDAMAGAIETVTHDEDARSALRTAGLVRARRFDWETAAGEHLDAYRRVAASR